MPFPLFPLNAKNCKPQTETCSTLYKTIFRTLLTSVSSAVPDGMPVSPEPIAASAHWRHPVCHDDRQS